jgi:hypothetical protein
MGNSDRLQWTVHAAEEPVDSEALAVMEGEQHIDVLFTDIGLHGDIHAGLE